MESGKSPIAVARKVRHNNLARSDSTLAAEGMLADSWKAS